VCSLWRSAALSPQLWTNLDFSSHIRERQRTELNLKWLIENRMKMCRDANLANWKITNVECVLEKLAEHCPLLTGLSLSGWKVLTPDNMVYIAQEFKNLERLDLSSVNVRRKSKEEKRR
jgi:F-box and leucine-rich repeat protein 6